MRVALVQSLGAAAVVYVIAATSVRADCSATPKQLTWECGDACDAHTPCVVYNATDDCAGCSAGDNEECKYQCFPQVDDTGDFLYLIPFGSYQSEQEQADRAANPNYAAALADYEAYASDGADAFPSNDNLTSIAAMDLASNVTVAFFFGGPTYDRYLSDKVVTVDLAPDLLTRKSKLEMVGFSSFDLDSVVGDLPTMLPAGIKRISLQNCVLTMFNVDLKSSFQLLTHINLKGNHLQSFSASHPTLQTMDLSKNELKTFDVQTPQLTTLILSHNALETFELELPQLQYLELLGNNLSSFNTSLPNLMTLILADNALTSIPPSVFELTKLTELNLSGNPLLTPMLTGAQAAFLEFITLDITNADISGDVNCSGLEERRINTDLTVCITDGSPISDSTITGPTPTPATTDSSSADSPTTTTTRLGLTLGLVSGAVILAVVFVGASTWYQRPRFRSSRDFFSDSTAILADSKPLAVPSSLWSDGQLCALRVNVDDICDVRELGSGSFGVVWLVKYRISELLASKRLIHSPDNEARVGDQERMQAFVNEIKLVAGLEHSNIVRFVGVAWKYHNDLQALFEYMELGDLREHLATSVGSNAGVWNAQKFRLAIDVAEALVYVHSFELPVVHRDIKSRNVLLTSQDTTIRAKLTDFGTARSQSEEVTMTAAVGTGRWIAPEVLAGSPDYGPAADMYSFGVLLSELDTHAIPYDDTVCRSSQTDGKMTNIALLQMVAAGTLRPSFRPNCPPAVRELAERCLAQDAWQRPTAVQVHYALRLIEALLLTP